MPDITILAHNIRSTHNVGAIFRTAEGFGVTRIILSGYTPYPRLDDDTRLPHISSKLDSQISKTALGAERLVPFEQYDMLREWLDLNDQTARLPIVALEQTPDAVHLQEFQPPDAFALLLGEEVEGIDPDLLSRCDAVVEIPMHGKKESFNVSVATGIALYGLTSA